MQPKDVKDEGDTDGITAEKYDDRDQARFPLRNKKSFFYKHLTKKLWLTEKEVRRKEIKDAGSVKIPTPCREEVLGYDKKASY